MDYKEIAKEYLDSPDFRLIPASDFVKEVIQVAQATPEYKYVGPEDERGDTECLYVHPATPDTPECPGCIMGVVLHNLGIPLDVLRNYEYIRIPRVLTDFVESNPHVVMWAADIQKQQDCGYSWGDAVNWAKIEYPELEEFYV